MNEILEKNDQLVMTIKHTNISYRNLLLSIGKIDELIITIDALMKLDSDIIKIIKPLKYNYLNSAIDDKYEFIGNYAYSKHYIQNKQNFKKQNKGKWMLFGTSVELLEYWKIIRFNTYGNELGYFAKFVGNEKGKVISIYFTDYTDKEKIMEYGNKIKDLIDYKQSMYFKPCHMTTKKQYGSGSWLYKINGDAYEFVD